MLMQYNVQFNEAIWRKNRLIGKDIALLYVDVVVVSVSLLMLLLL